MNQRDIQKQFDALAMLADDPNVKALIGAIALQTQALSMTLAVLPHEIAAILGRSK
jgi:hypothetical protein